MCETGKMPCFRERLNQLFTESGQTIVAFANHLGTSRQSLGYYLNGQRIPDAKMIQQICERCKVSADWLLGLSKVKRPNIELQALSQYTGLSEAAIIGLKQTKKSVINCILSDDETLDLFCKMLGYIQQSWIENNLLSFAYDPPNKIVEVFQNQTEFYKILAGRTTESIVDIILNMDNPFGNEGNIDGKP